MSYENQLQDDACKRILIEYLLAKVKEQDWHAVSDAANDLRVIEERIKRWHSV